MLSKINAVLRKTVIPLNVVNIIVGLLMGIAYVYIPFTSIFGLLLGIATAISGSATIGISYYFTSKNIQPKDTKHDTESEKTHLENTKASNIFLGFAIPMIFLNSAASFFGMYTGILLLAGALGTPLAPAAIISVSIIFACVLAGGTLINSWLQTHNIWEGLKKTVVDTKTSSNDLVAEPAQIKHHPKNELPEIPTFKSQFKSTTPARASQYVGSLFPHETSAAPYSNAPHSLASSLPQQRRRRSF